MSTLKTETELHYRTQKKSIHKVRGRLSLSQNYDQYRELAHRNLCERNKSRYLANYK